MTNDIFEIRKACPNDIPKVLEMIRKRVEWMEQAGYKEWNSTNYLSIHNYDYFFKTVEREELYIAAHNGITAGAFVLLQEDDRWPDNKEPAYYIHNFVSDLNFPGTGDRILSYCEQRCKEEKKQKLRLDCTITSEKLNAYYEKKGFQKKGYIEIGLYKGYKREKTI